MRILKKTYCCIVTFFIVAASLPATTFNISLNAGKSNGWGFGVSSFVSQDITKTLSFESSVEYFIKGEYEAGLQAAFTPVSWFSTGGGFFLFTDEGFIFPGVTANLNFLGRKAKTGILGAIGLGDSIKKPYMYRVASKSHFVTEESIIDVCFQWQLIHPQTFSRTDYSTDIKAYAISPENEKFRICLGLSSTIRMDSRHSRKFEPSAGVSFGFDIGTEEKGYYASASFLPLNPRTRPWMITSGMRFSL